VAVVCVVFGVVTVRRVLIGHYYLGGLLWSAVSASKCGCGHDAH
jgi:hypothetical protein